MIRYRLKFDFMPYSQKYTIVQFFQPVEEGERFSMYNWPLHITLADVFAIDFTNELMSDLQDYINILQHAVTYIESESRLGETPVWPLKQTKELMDIHRGVVDILEKHGVIFNTPAFTRDGFIPHITKQENSQLRVGDKIEVNIFSLIDMFPCGNWQDRKVVRNFHPSK